MGNTFFRLSGRMAMPPVLAILLSCSQGISPAEEPPVAEVSDHGPATSAESRENMSKMFKGTVVEVIDTGRHIYIRIDTGEKRVWVAAPAFDGKAGDVVLVPPGVPVADFHSKKLNRDFEMIYFVGGIRRLDERMVE